MRVGVVGTGEMGRPLVHRLLAAGLEVRAFVRRDEVRTELTAAGVTCVDAAADVASGADVVLVYVYRDDQVRQVVLDDGLADAMPPGSVLAVLTTGSPDTVRTIAERLQPRGVGVIDAPGSGSPKQMEAGTLTLFVGGHADQVARVEPVFAAYAATVVHVGPLGAGQQVKLLNNLLFGAHVELAFEAARLCEAFGLDPVLVTDTLRTGSGSSYALGLIPALGSADELLRKAGPFLHKDVTTAQEVAYGIRAELGSLDAVIAPLLRRLPGG
jgi:3-hydroxyisobutyrate dehydrogenase-like beta-hydroxyacid dehydrogenase